MNHTDRDLSMKISELPAPLFDIVKFQTIKSFLQAACQKYRIADDVPRRH